jgi:hypothetical protein
VHSLSEALGLLYGRDWGSYQVRWGSVRGTHYGKKSAAFLGDKTCSTKLNF